MNKTSLIIGLVLLAIADFLIYQGALTVSSQVNVGFEGVSYEIFALAGTTFLCLIFMIVFGLVLRWKFSPSYYLIEGGYDQYRYLEVKEEGATAKKIKYSFYVIIFYLSFSAWYIVAPFAYTYAGSPSMPGFILFGWILSFLSIFFGGIGLSHGKERRGRPPTPEVT